MLSPTPDITIKQIKSLSHHYTIYPEILRLLGLVDRLLLEICLDIRADYLLVKHSWHNIAIITDHG